jgi:hypothetical protein
MAPALGRDQKGPGDDHGNRKREKSFHEERSAARNAARDQPIAPFTVGGAQRHVVRGERRRQE